MRDRRKAKVSGIGAVKSKVASHHVCSFRKGLGPGVCRLLHERVLLEHERSA